MTTQVRKYVTQLLTLGVVLLGLWACSSPPPEKAEPYVKVENTAMDGYVEINELRWRHKYDMLQFSVNALNRTNSTVRFQYKFRFYDVDGFEVQPEGRPWTPVTLTGKEAVNIQVAAPNETVLGAKIYIQEAPK